MKKREDDFGPENDYYSCGSNFQAQQYYALAVAPDRQQLAYSGKGLSWVPLPPYGDAGGAALGGVPHRSVIELSVTPFDRLYWDDPERSQRSALAVGKVIGLDFTVADFDTAPAIFRGYHTLAGDIDAWWQADLFVDFILIGVEDRPTLVTSYSWGRIKASFH